jgi:hypothetical protein
VTIGNLVFKFPNIWFKSLFRVYWWYITGSLGHSWSIFKKISMLLWNTQHILLQGLRENAREALIMFQPQDKRLPRLYLPLFILNVYRRENGVGNEMFEKFTPMVFFDRLESTGEKELQLAIRNVKVEQNGKFDPHMFCHENFSYNGGNVVFLDYGEKGFIKFAREHGDKLERVLLTFLKKEALKKS